MSAAQTQVRVTATDDHLPPGASHPGRAAGPGQTVGRTGLDGRPVPVEQDSARPALMLLTEQLIEPFQAHRGA